VWGASPTPTRDAAFTGDIDWVVNIQNFELTEADCAALWNVAAPDVQRRPFRKCPPPPSLPPVPPGETAPLTAFLNALRDIVMIRTQMIDPDGDQFSPTLCQLRDELGMLDNTGLSSVRGPGFVIDPSAGIISGVGITLIDNIGRKAWGQGFGTLHDATDRPRRISLNRNPDMRITALRDFDRPAHWYNADNAAAENNITYLTPADREIVQLENDAGNVTQMVGEAIPHTPGMKYKIKFRARVASGTPAAQNIVQFHEINTDLAQDEMYIGEATAVAPDSEGHRAKDQTVVPEQITLTATMAEYEMTYTPTDGTRYFSPAVLNPSGITVNIEVAYYEVWPQSPMAAQPATGVGIWNPDFATVRDDGTETPAGWYITDSGVNSENFLTYQGDDHRSGVRLDNFTGEGAMFSNAFRVVPGDLLRFSVRMRKETTTTNVTVKVQFANNELAEGKFFVGENLTSSYDTALGEAADQSITPAVASVTSTYGDFTFEVGVPPSAQWGSFEIVHRDRARRDARYRVHRHRPRERRHHPPRSNFPRCHGDDGQR
jgi:hypothetical protein